MTITLQEVANVATVSTGRTFYVERLGGNVYGAADYSGRTITLDDGVTAAEGPAELLVCDDGAEVLRTMIHAAAEVGPLLATL